jgi:regulatory protein
MISVEMFLRDHKPLPDDPPEDLAHSRNVDACGGIQAAGDADVVVDGHEPASSGAPAGAVDADGVASSRAGRKTTPLNSKWRKSHDARHTRRGAFGGRRSSNGSFGSSFSGLQAAGRDESSREDGQDVDSCREAALTVLDAAARSSGMLRDRLVAKGFDPNTVDEVIARLTAVRLIDDRAYAQSAVRFCLERMYGQRGTVMYLTRKGVDRVLAEEVAQEAALDGAFEESAWELGRSVAKKTFGLDPQVRKRRLWSAGGRKGHDPSMLRDIAHELFDGQGVDA